MITRWAIYYFHMPLFGAMAWWALEGRIPRAVFWAFAAAMVGGIAYRWNLGLDYKKALDVAVALIAGVTIYLVGRRGHLGDWLTARSLQYLGRISYSLYLTHYATSWIVVSIGCSLTPRQRPRPPCFGWRPAWSSASAWPISSTGTSNRRVCGW